MEHLQGLTIKQARKVLGVKSDIYSDSELEKMVEIATFMKNMFFSELSNNTLLQRSMEQSYNEFECQHDASSIPE